MIPAILSLAMRAPNLAAHNRAVRELRRDAREHRARRRRRRHLHELLVHRPVRAVAWAKSQLGVPYVWGGETPGAGFDCSGLVQWAYRQVGVSLPRTTWDMSRVGRWAPLNRLHPGDLVFANGGEHVGMYAGGGLVIQAPFTGALIQLTPLSVFGAEYARRVA